VADWVNVVPFTGDGHVVMVEQYRFGAGILSLEFPAGILEAGEEPAAGGARELREETGYQPAAVTNITSVYADPALQDNRLHVVVARGCTRSAAPDQDEGEDVHVRLVAVQDVPRLIREGKIVHALAIAAWFLATADSTAEAG
ncbi:MAG TPA: NUDIX hydrolase, partial [Longimicrobiales bacterium]